MSGNETHVSPALSRIPPLWRGPVLVGLVCFLIRVWFLGQVVATPFFLPLAGGNDRYLYQSCAEAIAGGQVFPAGVFEYMPLYPTLLGLLYRLTGPVPLAAALLGILFDTATAMLIVRLARRAGASAFLSVAAGLVYAAYPVAVCYSVMTMPNTLNALLVTSFAAVVFRRSLQSHRRWAAAGVLAGLGSLSFAGLLPMSLAFLAHRLAFDRSRPGRRCGAAGWFLLCLAVPMAPVLWHNHRHGGGWQVTAHGGFNLYMGNHEGATGYPVQIRNFRGTAGSLLVDAKREAERMAGRPLSPLEFSQFWTSRVRAFWREKPASAMGLWFAKWLRFWSRVDYDDMGLMPVLRLNRVAFGGFPWPGYEWIAVPGLWGLLALKGRGSLRGMTLVGVLGLTLFFITARYRLALAPLLAVLGAVIATNALRCWRGNRVGRVSPWARNAVIAGSLPIAAAFVFWPLPKTDFRALDLYNTGAYWLSAGQAEQAMSFAELGLALEPDNADMQYLAGNALFGLDRVDEARVRYGKAVALNPDFAEAWFNLAVCLKRLGRTGEALSAADRAVRLYPDDVPFLDLQRELRASTPNGVDRH